MDRILAVSRIPVAGRIYVCSTEADYRDAGFCFNSEDMALLDFCGELFGFNMERTEDTIFLVIRQNDNTTFRSVSLREDGGNGRVAYRINPGWNVPRLRGGMIGANEVTSCLWEE